MTNPDEKTQEKIWNQDVLLHEHVFEWQSKTKTLAIRAKIGQILLDDPTDKTRTGIAKMGYSYYKADTATSSSRPLTVLFNGGPGSSSQWLHFAAFGPHKVEGLSLNDVEKNIEAKLVQNPDSLLAYSDLVFIDPIGTGFSEVIDEETAKKFYDMDTDAESIAAMIHKFIIEFGLWEQPLYIAGESYGGIRSAKVCENLMMADGIFPKGLIMIAPFLNGGSITECSESVLGRMSFFTGYALTAWFHGKSSLNETANSEAEVYASICQFLETEVLATLVRGSVNDLAEPVFAKLCAMIGIAPEVLREHGDRFDVPAFSKTFLQARDVIRGA